MALIDMDKEVADKLIGTMERARSSKFKYFIFCSFSFFLGLFLFFHPYEKDFMPLVHERTVFVKGIALMVSVICGPLALFFLISLPTKIWERICDWQTKKIRDAIEDQNDEEEQ